MAEKTIPTASEEKTPISQEETRQEERYLSPPVDIYESNEGLTVVADLPGVDKADIDVRVDENILTIKGKSKHISPGDPISREYSLLNFFRQFQLGEGVDQEKISADLKHGVLTLQLPKTEKVKPKMIKVSVAS